MLRLLLAASLTAAAPVAAVGQSLTLPAESLTDDATLGTAMTELAAELAKAPPPPDEAAALDLKFRIQMIRGEDADALKTIAALRSLTSGASPQARARNVQYEVLARARLLQAEGQSFDDAFRRAFRERAAVLDDGAAALAMRTFEGMLFPAGISLHLPIEERLKASLAAIRGKRDVTITQARDLLLAYQMAEAYRRFTPLIASLVDEDDERRYLIDKEVPVPTRDGATVCATVVRPRKAGPLPAALEFTIYADPAFNFSEARRSASNRYIGVEGLTRGKGCSPDAPVPIEHDGADAAALVDWITTQPWSDGRVGMFGGSYNGFTQWATAKQMPKGLKTIMPSVTFAPGVDSPDEGNIFDNYFYAWPFYTTTNKTLDAVTYGDQARWSKLNHEWYVSGRPYRDLPKIDGAPNPFFMRWLAHPSYDEFWQKVMPYRSDFKSINIPVLTSTGYYDGGEIGALYYLQQHYKFLPDAEHYLVVGPYDHVTGQRGTVSLLGDPVRQLDGYTLDDAAQIDIGELRYAWFDYVFKGAPKPAILADRINFEVTGANRWRHVRSLSEMGPGRERFYLSPSARGGLHPLSTHVQRGEFLQTLDLADRSDADRIPPAPNVLNAKLDVWNGVAYESVPFSRPTEISGLFAGRLAFVTNKKDFDVNISLFEETPDGHYLSLTYYETRASYAADREHRRLLEPGRPQALAFRAGRLMSGVFPPGGKLVVVVTLIRSQTEEINYGTGRDVADESIADGKVPLRIRWLGSSFIDIPLAEPRDAHAGRRIGASRDRAPRGRSAMRSPPPASPRPSSTQREFTKHATQHGDPCGAASAQTSL
jgi:uncharacterized protein